MDYGRSSVSELGEGQTELDSSDLTETPPTQPPDGSNLGSDQAVENTVADSKLAKSDVDDTAQMMTPTEQLPIGANGTVGMRTDSIATTSTASTGPTGPPMTTPDAVTAATGSSLAGAYSSSAALDAALSPPTLNPNESSATGGQPGLLIPEMPPPSPPSTESAPTADQNPASTGTDDKATLLPPSVPNTGWSTMGETPVAPPAQSGLAPGAPKYLPPVEPPGSVIAPIAAPAKAKGRWGWRALTSFVAGGLIAAAGFGAAQLSSTDSPSDQEGTEVAATKTSEEGVTTTTAQLLPPVDVEEPAAYVATLLGPAVVQVETDFGLGSGVIYDNGLILTNQHVVDGAREISIRLSDGRSFPAKLEGADPNTDIAVISVDEGLDLPVAVLATGEKATVGQVAIAIGSPFQLQQTVTAGIVSAVDRPLRIGNQRVVAMIQTDAPINPGNSGGALADKQGRVIGINTSIQTDGTTSTNAGVGFAVPIDTARSIADLLVSGAPIESGFLGVTGGEPKGGLAGVEVVEVSPGSSAEDAGLEIGDRVLSLDGAPVTIIDELAGLVLARQAGEEVELEIIRDGEPMTIVATLGARDG